jgi:hypothetical protein
VEVELRQDDLRRLAAVSSRTGLSVAAVIEVLEKATTAQYPSEISSADQTALTTAGIQLANGSLETASTVISGAAASQRLYDSALTVGQAAQKLSVTTGRVRQRIGAGLLAVVQRREGYVLPDWQFYDDRTVPHLKSVLAVAGDVHPVTLQGFMTTPNPDLEVDGGIVSPRDWLITGGDPARVAELAEVLHGQT